MNRNLLMWLAGVGPLSFVISQKSFLNGAYDLHLAGGFGIMIVIIAYVGLIRIWWLKNYLILFLLVSIALTAYEIAQVFMPGREFDWFDILAQEIGAAVAIWIVYASRRRKMSA